MLLQWRDVTLNGGPAINTSITEDETAVLQELARGRRVLEIGSAYGYSAVAMALAGAVSVDAVDPHTWIPGSEGVMRGNLEAHGVADRVTIHLGLSWDVLPALEPGTYGLLFIDGDHSRGALMRDVTLGRPLLAPGGVIAAHDYGEAVNPDVRPLLDELYPGGPASLTDTLFVAEPL